MPKKNYDSIFALEGKAPRTKGDITDAAVREILQQESEERAALTDRLRKARLARDEETRAKGEPAPEKPARKRAAK
ncbi:hypothetical protein V0U79_08585 [Hyphobacterium sp. HN65]|uniref:Transcriptional regulator n=1 Tax=Hyphobacterium lacteum TaxID=3116575 RepID=A0ABU7LR87_9PROT|nr:hypothetical protein [Hyphobacterium sp. HN65]MEE2526421.1 hypothetical protein [Hyphobacterium sp. HN65]